MNLTILGSCSGTEPMPARKHTSYVIEHNGGIYWFDAGEGCSYTAHLLGIDLLAVQSIFISHPHMDHVGGLANLLWTMQKLEGRNKDKDRGLSGKTVPVLIPNLNVWKGVLAVLGGPMEKFTPSFQLNAHTYEDGIIYNENGLSVTALHNRHLGDPPEGEPWQSFSFRIETGSKTLVSSGDVGHISELDNLIDGCDLFIMETGHHKVEDVCAHLRDKNLTFGKLGFFHHGRAILENPERELAKAQQILGDRVFIAEDGMPVTV